MRAAWISVLLVSAAAAQELKYDPNTPEALAAQAKDEAYRQEAKNLSPFEVFRELQRLDAARDARTQLQTPDQLARGAWTFGQSDEDKKAVSFGSVLETRSQAGDVAASFYNGVYRWRFCRALAAQNNAQAENLVTECWRNVMAGFKRAAEANVADASINVARMYANGFGVTASKFVAAEWYVKAAEQYNARKDRDEALTAVESALNLVPDHPGALRLRKAMVK